MRCQAIFLGSIRCTNTASWHVLGAMHGSSRSVRRRLCDDCMRQVIDLGADDGVLIAHHPLGSECRHPDSRWEDAGCVVPTVELTAEHATRSSEKVDA